MSHPTADYFVAVLLQYIPGTEFVYEKSVRRLRVHRYVLLLSSAVALGYLHVSSAPSWRVYESTTMSSCYVDELEGQRRELEARRAMLEERFKLRLATAQVFTYFSYHNLRNF